jgi:hypothetical protein
VQASPKTKEKTVRRKQRPTTKGFPSDDGSPGCHCHSGIVHIEQNSSKRKKSDIVGDTTHIQTERSDTDEVPAMSFKSLRYIKGLLFRMIKNLGASPDPRVRTKPLLRSPSASHSRLELDG